MLGNYEQSTLDKLHSTILAALKEFDRVCRKYDITYFVGFGTAIGAARHQGFIPWDDDIDICMMREEYEKLRQVPASEWSEPYVLSDPRDDYPFHRTLFPCFFMKGTAFETDTQVKYFKTGPEDKYPIHLDIFLFDYFDKAKLHKMIKKINIFKRLVLYSKRKFNIVKSDSFVRRIGCRIRRLISDILKITGYNSKKLYECYLKYLKKNAGSSVTGFEFVEGHEKIKFVSTYEEMFPVVYLKFEDMEVPMQKNYHEIMTRLYGDYMALPPVEQRWNSDLAILDFGDGNGNVIERDVV